MCYISKLISIIVPIYNVKDYIDRCISSIVNQTYHNLEIIVIDDGSYDGSAEVCEVWGKMDKRIRVFHKENGGLSSARNLGLEKARGEFIGFVDSDDYIKEDMYEDLLSAMEEGVDITCCGTAVIYPSDQKRRSEYYDRTSVKRLFSNNEAVSALLLKSCLSFSSCNKLFRKKLFEQIIYPVGRTSEDLPVIYELVKRSRSVINIGKTKYYYCYREGSISRKQFEIRRIDYVMFARDICRDVSICYPKKRKLAEVLYVRNIMAVIDEIDHCVNYKKYEFIRDRLRKVLQRMYINILLNEYISLDRKRRVLKIL